MALPTSRRRPPFPLPATRPPAKGRETAETGAPDDPMAQEAWLRVAYRQAVNADTWHLGDPMDAGTRNAVLAGIAGPVPPYYQGADGEYYFHNARTFEDATTRSHRARHFAGKTMDQIAAARMPGEDEYVAARKGNRTASKSVPAANDNVLQPPAAPKAVPVSPANDDRVRTPRPTAILAQRPPDSASGPPTLSPIVNAGRVAGMARAANAPGLSLEDFAQAADDYIRLGAVGLTGGYADDISAGLNAFFSALGGANLAEAYAANREEERRRTDAARERRGAPGTIAEAAPGFVPVIGDVSGLLADFRDYLENGDEWTAADWALVAAGLAPGMPNRRTAKAGKKVVDGLAAGRKIGGDLLAQIEHAKANVYTVSEARHLAGEHRGLIFVAEKLPRNPKARVLQSSADGAFSDIRTQKFASAALRYQNPNNRGNNFIKFDVAGLAEDGKTIELVDTKTKLAIWSAGAQGTTSATLKRVQSALDQNPGYRVVYEFPNERAAKEAREYIRANGFAKYVAVRVKKQ